MAKISSFLDDIPKLTHSTWPEKPNISIIRGDQLHPIVSGNKLYKLLPVVQSLSPSTRTLISVGGRYSNHLHALAWVGQRMGYKTVGIIQGYRGQPLTPTLIDCQDWGMTFHFVDKATFRQRNHPLFWNKWALRYKNAHCIQEGGWSDEAIAGSQSWWDGVPSDTNIVLCAVGSGATLAGLSMSAPHNVSVVGIPVFKDPEMYLDLTTKLADKGIVSQQFSLWTEFAGPGFGKLSNEQRVFGLEFTEDTGIPLDPVYTTKVFFALHKRLESDPLLQQQKISILHTGGLQGSRN